MAYEWGRLIWWLGQNAAAIQALTAIVVVLLTAALVFVTSWYVRLTREMSQTMNQQLAAASIPDIGIAFTRTLESVSRIEDVKDEFAEDLQIQNKSTFPVKLARTASGMSLSGAVGMENRMDNSVRYWCIIRSRNR
jgi:HAMP domain-containing protein